MNHKYYQNIFNMIVTVNLIEENVIQIKSGINICANMSVKIKENIVYMKKIMFEILLIVLVKLIYIQGILLMA